MIYIAPTSGGNLAAENPCLSPHLLHAASRRSEIQLERKFYDSNNSSRRVRAEEKFVFSPWGRKRSERVSRYGRV